MSEKLKKGQTTPLETDIRKISIKLIDGFPNHPFYVFDDDEMSDLTESIRKNGLISPVIVRQKADRFELISGHRRKHACELLGHDEIACRIVEASDDEAIIMMVDSNCQRTKVLPSERAFAYKMKLEANEDTSTNTELAEKGTAYTLTEDTTKITLKATGTAGATGYCSIKIGSETYYTEQIFVGGTFTFTVNAATGTTITLTPKWGTYSGTATIQNKGEVTAIGSQPSNTQTPDNAVTTEPSTEPTAPTTPSNSPTESATTAPEPSATAPTEPKTIDTEPTPAPEDTTPAASEPTDTTSDSTE